MKMRINRTVFFGVLAAGLFFLSYYSTKGTYLERISSVAFGACTAIFIGYLIGLIAYYRKNKKQEANGTDK